MQLTKEILIEYFKKYLEIPLFFLTIKLNDLLILLDVGNLSFKKDVLVSVLSVVYLLTVCVFRALSAEEKGIKIKILNEQRAGIQLDNDIKKEQLRLLQKENAKAK